MTHKPVLRVVQQRTDSDCCISVLATLFQLPYEEVLVAAARVANYEPDEGMYLTQVQKTAEELGYELKRIRPGRYDLSDVTGILYVYDKKRKIDHVVTVGQGSIIETDGGIWKPSEYFAAMKYKAGALLVEA